MPSVRLLAIIALCALPCTASAQPWADAYKAGDYPKAAELLHTLAVDERFDQSGDPAPARQLAVMYAQGQGVPQDSIFACSMARLADMIAQTRRPDVKVLADMYIHIANRQESERFFREHCDRLTEYEKELAARAMGCKAIGMPEQDMTVGTQTVHVGRAGIRLADAPAADTQQWLNCPQLIVRVRSVTVSPPSDAAPGVKPRYFVELLAWRQSYERTDSPLTKILSCYMYEVLPGKIKLVTMAQLYSAEGYPQLVLPADLDERLSLEMIRSGHIRWRFDDVPPKRGWIMLEQESAR